LAERGKIVGIYLLFIDYMKERAFEGYSWLQLSFYLSSVDQQKKIRSRKQTREIWEHSYVNMTMQLWNQLSADALGALSCKPSRGLERIVSELWVRKRVQRRGCGLLWYIILKIVWRMEEYNRIIIRDSRCPRHVLNKALSKCRSKR
jgi:hypothetical protein